jgi:hypothetical protein
MTRYHLVPIALLAAVSSAHAQHWGGSPSSTASKPAAEVHQASSGSWNGTASKWGGSPVEHRAESRERPGSFGQANAYIPATVSTPAYLPVTYAADSACTTPIAGPAQMQVVIRETRPLTTIESYRLQPRFQKP